MKLKTVNTNITPKRVQVKATNNFSINEAELPTAIKVEGPDNVSFCLGEKICDCEDGFLGKELAPFMDHRNITISVGGLALNVNSYDTLRTIINNYNSNYGSVPGAGALFAAKYSPRIDEFMEVLVNTTKAILPVVIKTYQDPQGSLIDNVIFEGTLCAMDCPVYSTANISSNTGMNVKQGDISLYLNGEKYDFDPVLSGSSDVMNKGGVIDLILSSNDLYRTMNVPSLDGNNYEIENKSKSCLEVKLVQVLPTETITHLDYTLGFFYEIVL